MRIRIGALKSSLSEEISALEVKASDCRVWLEKMGSFDLSVFGLEGEGFKVLSSRVQDQGVYVRGFFLLVDAVRRGDEANRKAVGMLEPSESDGSVDVDHLKSLVGELRGKIKDCMDRIDEAKNTDKYGQWGSSVAQGAQYWVDKYSGPLREYERKLGKVVAYERASGSFYAEAESLSPVVGMMQAAMIAVCEGRVPDVSWQKDVDARWDKWVQANGDEIRRYMTDSQRKAFDKACENWWQEADFYRDGKLNKDLWQGLARVPQWLLSNTIATAAARSYTVMLEHNDVVSLQDVAIWLYPPTGQKHTVKVLSTTVSSGRVYTAVFDRIVYGFRKSGLLARMLEEFNKIIASAPMFLADGKTLDPQWSNRMAVHTLLSMENNIMTQTADGQVYGAHPDKLDIHIGYSWNKKNTNDTARLFVLSVEPGTDPIDSHKLRDDWLKEMERNFNEKQLSKMYYTCAGVSGLPRDVSKLVHRLQNKEGLSNYNFFYSAGSQVVKMLVDKVISSIPVYGTLLEKFEDFHGGITDDYLQRVEADNLNNINEAGVNMAGNNLFHDMGFSMFYSDSAGQNEENYIHPLTKLILDDKMRVKVQTVIDMYNRTHSSHYTFNKFQADLRDNAFTIHNIDSKEGKDTRAFIEWCAQPADLVYKRDVTDDDGVVHHKGEEVNDLRNVSNYSFITNSNSHSYKDYVFASAVK